MLLQVSLNLWTPFFLYIYNLFLIFARLRQVQIPAGGSDRQGREKGGWACQSTPASTIPGKNRLSSRIGVTVLQRQETDLQCFGCATITYALQ